MLLGEQSDQGLDWFLSVSYSYIKHPWLDKQRMAKGVDSWSDCTSFNWKNGLEIGMG